MQFITQLLFQYNVSTSVMTLITLLLTWFPLGVGLLFYLTERPRILKEKQGQLFVELSVLPVALLAVHVLLFGRQAWRVYDGIDAYPLFWPILNVLENMSVYLALPGAFTGLLCGVLLFETAWNSRKFWLSFWGYTGIALVVLTNHVLSPHFSIPFVSFDFAETLAIWGASFLLGVPLVLIGAVVIVALNLHSIRSPEKGRAVSVASERSDFAH